MGWAEVPVLHLILLPFIWISTLLYLYIVFVILTSKKKSHFRTPFFSIVLAQAFWDLSMFFCAFFVVFCRKFCLLAFPEGENIPIAKIIYFIQTLLPVCMYGNCLLYAASRLSAFYLPMRVEQLWQPKNVALCMLLIVCFGAMVVGSMFLESTSIWLKREQATGRMVMGANPRLIERTCIQDLVLSLSSCFICSVVYVHLAAKKSSAAMVVSGREGAPKSCCELFQKYQRAFFRCAVTVFIPYIPNTFKSSLLFYASYTGNQQLAHFCVESWLYVIYLMCLLPPWALLFTCPSLRPSFNSHFSDRPDLTMSNRPSKFIQYKIVAL